MFIAGTVRNTLSLASLDSKWQQKKQQDPAKKNEDKLTADQRELQRFQEQLKEMRENKSPDINAKLMSGGKLTQEEIEYLRKNDPQKLKEYEEVQQERANYKKQLKGCKSKEEVERLKMTKMGQYMSQAKGIASDSCIPKSEKYKLMVKLLSEANGVAKEHVRFTQSLRYAQLPEEDEDAKKKANADSEDIPKENPESGISDVLTTDENADVTEQIKLMAEALAPGKGAGGQEAAPQSTGEVLDVKV